MRRFLKWCLLLYAWLVVLGACFYVADLAGLDGWIRFIALVPVLVGMRFSIQRFLRRGPP